MRAPHRIAACIAMITCGCNDPTLPPSVIDDAAPQAATQQAVGIIAYLIGAGGDFDIYVGNADGTDLIDVSNNDAWDSGPIFSPNGRRIVFYSNRDADPFDSDIYVMNVDGSDVRRLTDFETAANPHWSPSGQHIAFESADKTDWIFDVYVMDADGGNVTNLTNSKSSDDFKPVWSPNGRTIAFSSDRDPAGGVFDYDIYLMDADGGNVRRLTTSSGFNLPWSWSPDGGQLAFYRSDGVYVINVDGTGETNLTNDPTMGDALGSFAPHGQQIAFSRDPIGPGDARPWIMNADGSDKREIPIPPELLAGGRLAHPYDWSHR